MRRASSKRSARNALAASLMRCSWSLALRPESRWPGACGRRARGRRRRTHPAARARCPRRRPRRGRPGPTRPGPPGRRGQRRCRPGPAAPPSARPPRPCRGEGSRPRRRPRRATPPHSLGPRRPSSRLGLDRAFDVGLAGRDPPLRRPFGGPPEPLGPGPLLAAEPPARPVGLPPTLRTSSAGWATPTVALSHGSEGTGHHPAVCGRRSGPDRCVRSARTASACSSARTGRHSKSSSAPEAGRRRPPPRSRADAVLSPDAEEPPAAGRLTGGSSRAKSAATYSPGTSPSKYHRRRRA